MIWTLHAIASIILNKLIKLLLSIYGVDKHGKYKVRKTLKINKLLKVGSFYDIKVKKAFEYDVLGEIVN